MRLFPSVARFGYKANCKRGNLEGWKERWENRPTGRKSKCTCNDQRLNYLASKINYMSFIPLVNLSRSHSGAALFFLMSIKSTVIFLANQMYKFKHLWLRTTYYLCPLPISIQLQSPAHISPQCIYVVSIITFITWILFSWTFSLFCLPLSLYILNVHSFQTNEPKTCFWSRNYHPSVSRCIFHGTSTGNTRYSSGKRQEGTAE